MALPRYLHRHTLCHNQKGKRTKMASGMTFAHSTIKSIPTHLMWKKVNATKTRRMRLEAREATTTRSALLASPCPVGSSRMNTNKRRRYFGGFSGLASSWPARPTPLGSARASVSLPKPSAEATAAEIRSHQAAAEAAAAARRLRATKSHLV